MKNYDSRTTNDSVMTSFAFILIWTRKDTHIFLPMAFWLKVNLRLPGVSSSFTLTFPKFVLTLRTCLSTTEVAAVRTLRSPAEFPWSLFWPESVHCSAVGSSPSLCGSELRLQPSPVVSLTCDRISRLEEEKWWVDGHNNNMINLEWHSFYFKETF